MAAAITTGDTLVGKYRVESVLGEGGMGVVLAARHLDLGCLVAIKVIRAQLGADEPLVRRLMFEARAAARIRSEHVCRVLDVSRLEDGSPFIVMEHLEGETLGQTLGRVGVLPEQLAVDYVLQACEPLAEAHAAGIIHRDLKPENLFLARRPDASHIIKVLDFGISKATSASALRAHAQVTRADAAVGSPFYMAPEQMAARADLDHRADIWALGAILYQLTTGSMPFDGDSLPEVCAAVLRAAPVPPRVCRAELSERFEHCVLRCLQSDRERRYGSVAQLARDIAPCASETARVFADRISRILRDVSPGPALYGSDTQDVPRETARVSSASGLPAPEPARLATPDRMPSGGLPAPTGADGLSHSRTVPGPPRGRTARWIGYAILAVGVVGGIGAAAVAMSGGSVPGAGTGVPDQLAGVGLEAGQVHHVGSDVVRIAQPTGAPSASAPALDSLRPVAVRVRVSPPVAPPLATSNHPPAGPAATEAHELHNASHAARAARPVSRGSTSENKRVAQDAWNPDNFGGRR